MGHVTYACNCLNVKIHLANKYYLDGHEKFRNKNFTRLQEPPIAGWKFELGMEGVTVEFASLIRPRIIMDNPDGWITIDCHNCTTGDVYSVKRPNAKIAYPFDHSILSKSGDQVIIHKGTLFGSEIEKLQKKAIYSSAFHIILNSDLPIYHVSQEDEDIYDPELKHQHEQVQQLLKQSLITLEEQKEKKIQEFQKEQEILLVREKEKATYDSTILWQRMKEIAKTVQEEEQRVWRLACQKNRASEAQQDDTALETEMRNGKFHDCSFEPETQQQRRSLDFKRGLSGGFTAPSHSSVIGFGLDESAPVPEMPPFHRRRSCLVAPFSQHDCYLHPLVQPNTTAVVPTFSREDNQDNMKSKADNDSEEDLFPLDEDMQGPDDYDSSPRVKRNPSSKYIEEDQEEETSKTNAHHEQQDHNFARSVPITIHHTPALEPVQKVPSSSFIHFDGTATDRNRSLAGVDYYAEADRRASLTFPPFEHSSRLNPRILAANTITNETDYCPCGSVPGGD